MVGCQGLVGLLYFSSPIFSDCFFSSFSCSILLGKKRERFEGYFKTVQIPQNSQNIFITVVLSLN
jgi:hypothetical protein